MPVSVRTAFSFKLRFKHSTRITQLGMPRVSAFGISAVTVALTPAKGLREWEHHGPTGLIDSSGWNGARCVPSILPKQL